MLDNLGRTPSEKNPKSFLQATVYKGCRNFPLGLGTI